MTVRITVKKLFLRSLKTQWEWEGDSQNDRFETIVVIEKSIDRARALQRDHRKVNRENVRMKINQFCMACPFLMVESDEMTCEGARPWTIFGWGFLLSTNSFTLMTWYIHIKPNWQSIVLRAEAKKMIDEWIWGLTEGKIVIWWEQKDYWDIDIFGEVTKTFWLWRWRTITQSLVRNCRINTPFLGLLENPKIQIPDECSPCPPEEFLIDPYFGNFSPARECRVGLGESWVPLILRFLTV